LPETERFAQLKTEKKHFIDTIKLIAYRAESALTGEIREALARDDDCRVLLRRLFVTPANLRPDPVAQTLTVELHRLGSSLQDLAVAHFCQFLTESETLFPTTNLRLIFRQVPCVRTQAIISRQDSGVWLSLNEHVADPFVFPGD
jgi:hypothetical protein